MLVGSEVKRPVATLCEPHAGSLPLGKESFKRDLSPREDTQVPVHRQDVLVTLKRCRNTNRNCLLPDAAEPFADLSLPQE